MTAAEACEVRPFRPRIMSLNSEERAAIAEHRFRELDKLLKASGCATMPDPASLAVNFHTGDHLMVVQVDKNDPRRVSLFMVLSQTDGDLAKAKWACAEATGSQFASKATVYGVDKGYSITLSVGVYAEVAYAFGDSLKAYIDDIIGLYNDFVDFMVADDP